MTNKQKTLIKYLLMKDHYLMRLRSHTGVVKYKLFQGNQIPVRWFEGKTVSGLTGIFKEDKKGRLTLNLSLVRQKHGNAFIKRQYKQKSKHETNHS